MHGLGARKLRKCSLGYGTTFTCGFHFMETTQPTSVELMHVPHHSVVDNHGASLGERYAPTIPGSEAIVGSAFALTIAGACGKFMKFHHVGPGYLHLHPECWFAMPRPSRRTSRPDQSICSATESDDETVCRSDVTECVYSAGTTTTLPLAAQTCPPQAKEG